MCQDPVNHATDLSGAQVHANAEGLIQPPPDVLETIKARIDELSPDLRKLSLDLHGKARVFRRPQLLTSAGLCSQSRTWFRRKVLLCLQYTS